MGWLKFLTIQLGGKPTFFRSFFFYNFLPVHWNQPKKNHVFHRSIPPPPFFSFLSPSLLVFYCLDLSCFVVSSILMHFLVFTV